MNTSHISQKSPIAAAFAAFMTLSVHFIASPVRAYSPEAESVLEALQTGMAAGLVSESEYQAFLYDLEEEDACDTWASAKPNLTDAVWRDILEVCPDLNQPVSRSPTLRTHGSALQSVQPRTTNTPYPNLRGETRTPFGGMALSLRDLTLYDRRMEVQRGAFSVNAGHVHGALLPTQLDFVVGSRFYTGWTGQSGFSGPLASPKSALDGLSLAYRVAHWEVQAAGTWNSIQNKNQITSTAHEPDRKDALLYLFGLARKNLKLQLAHQRFESSTASPVSVSICGGSLRDSHDRWRIGLAGSLWKVKDPISGSRELRPGLYGEGVIGQRGNSQLEISQASPSWSNPLQSPRGYRQDTLDGQWILPGRGEGRLHARSQIPIFNHGEYQMDLKAGSDVIWLLGTTGLLAAQSRLALIQALGNWSYTCGTGSTFKRSRLIELSPTGEEALGGIGHILQWHDSRMKARMTFIQQKTTYQGPYPEPLSLSFERLNAQWPIRKIKAEVFIGNIQDPASYLRLSYSQEWDMGSGLILKQTLRLPWSQNEGWKKDLRYQLGLEANL